MVFRVEARQAYHPLDRFDVFPVDRAGPALAFFTPAVEGVPASLHVCSYPEGNFIEDIVGPAAIKFESELAPSAAQMGRTFDFDADGALDSIESGVGTHWGLVRILSGRDKRVLLEDDDPLEYECRDRAIPLGDIDGDGYSELALLHPRKDRSKYDIEPCDWLFGAKSWITIVSGSRVVR